VRSSLYPAAVFMPDRFSFLFIIYIVINIDSLSSALPRICSPRD